MDLKCADDHRLPVVESSKWSADFI